MKKRNFMDSEIAFFFKLCQLPVDMAVFVI